ncbi:hypothetical protein IWX50DRAFT_644252 [Phyllosticta citricarpa]
MLWLLCVLESISLHWSTFPYTLLANFDHSPANTVSKMICKQLTLLLMLLNTLTLGAPAVDTVNDVARQQSQNLPKHVIIPYIPARAMRGQRDRPTRRHRLPRLLASHDDMLRRVRQVPQRRELRAFLRPARWHLLPNGRRRGVGLR